MNVYTTVAEMRAALKRARRAGTIVGLVPTMGALHAGHLSLVRAARAQCDFVVVTIFVNPMQFGPSEDLEKYPRPFAHDRQLLEGEKVDALFAPPAKEMYGEAAEARAGASAPDVQTFVEVPGLSDKLDGHSRPGHFRGVTTVVAKLLHIVEPDVAFFGQKDAAQVAVLRRMVRDLNFPAEIRVCPIVREADGLALSSRNRYLDGQQRQQALVLHRALVSVQATFENGERDPRRLAEEGRSVIALEPAARLDSFEIVDPDTLEPLSDLGRPALVAVAAWIGATRLIDNLLLGASATATRTHSR